jgi:hypothetical protein
MADLIDYRELNGARTREMASDSLDSFRSANNRAAFERYGDREEQRVEQKTLSPREKSEKLGEKIMEKNKEFESLSQVIEYVHKGIQIVDECKNINSFVKRNLSDLYCQKFHEYACYLPLIKNPSLYPHYCILNNILCCLLSIQLTKQPELWQLRVQFS